MNSDSVERWLWRIAVVLFLSVLLMQCLLAIPTFQKWLVPISKWEGMQP